ncbi:MAG: 3-deoxy-manno-octulosonate cytidylyltransferase [Rikenellaceae bacterium]|nr:3-deoxy-manno-octulosonate cytidylyltransferase [Rikenellaceae bacterium]
MRFIAIIPARYASTRFPGKPLADIGGQTMIERVYRRVNAVFENLCVATDDERIEQVVKAFGGTVAMTSEAHRSGTDRVGEALDTIERTTGERFDVAVNVQGDEPFVAEEHLVKIRALFDDPAIEIATLVKPFADGEDIFNPNSPKVVLDGYGNALMFSRSAIPHLRGVPPEEWSSKHTYLKHIGLYAYRADTLRAITQLPQGELERAESLEQLRWLENGYRIRTALTASETVAVDTPEDLQRVLAMLDEKIKKA